MVCAPKQGAGTYAVSSPYSRAGMLEQVALGSECQSKSSRASCEEVDQCEWTSGVGEEGDGAEDGKKNVPVVGDAPTPPVKWWWMYVWAGLAVLVVLVIGVCVATSRRDAAHLNDAAGDEIDMSRDPALDGG